MRWGVKIGEGLLIGLGASIAFAVCQAIYDAMSNATAALKAAEARLESQDTVNTQMKRLVEQLAKEQESLRRALETRGAASEHAEPANGQAGGSNHKTFDPLPFRLDKDWKINVDAPLHEEASAALPSVQMGQFEALEETIKQQQSIRFRSD